MDYTIDCDIEKSFERIARELMFHHVLSINEHEFAFVDIEFYYQSANHDDQPHTLKKVRPAGELEKHQYGIDISLGNGETEYGGILLRGLYDLSTNKLVAKPEVTKVIINNLNLGPNMIEIKEKVVIDLNNEYFQTIRLNLAQSPYQDKLYRFITHDKKVFVNFPNKEKTLDNAALSDEAKDELRGYKRSKS